MSAFAAESGHPLTAASDLMQTFHATGHTGHSADISATYCSCELPPIWTELSGKSSLSWSLGVCSVLRSICDMVFDCLRHYVAGQKSDSGGFFVDFVDIISFLDSRTTLPVPSNERYIEKPLQRVCETYGRLLENCRLAVLVHGLDIGDAGGMRHAMGSRSTRSVRADH